MGGTRLPEDVRVKIREIVAEVLEVDLAQITEESSFVNDHEADSLLVIEIFSRFERDLHIKIPMNDLTELDSLAEAYDMVARHYVSAVVGE